MPEEYLDTTRFNQFQTKAYYFTNNKDKTNFMLGMETTLMSGRGTKIGDKKKKFNEMALFGSAVINYKKLKINPGMRILHQSQFGKEIGNSGVKLAPIIPTLHVKYKVNGKNNLRFSMASGYRAPDIKELYFYFVDRNHNIFGNDDLKPEQSIHTDIKWHKRTSMGKDKMLSLSSGIFYNNVINKIQLVSIGGINNEFSYANLGEINTLGGQGGLTYQSKHWDIKIGLSANGLNTQASDVKWNNQLIGSVSYTERFSRIIFNLSNKWNGASYGFNDDLTMFKVEQYHIGDFSMTKKILRKRFNLTTGIKNLWNITNLQSTGNSALGHSSEFGNIPIGLGRTFYININFVLHYKKNKKPKETNE
jgi:outer membrane receptor for ferrienterochelin and colicins